MRFCGPRITATTTPPGTPPHLDHPSLRVFSSRGPRAVVLDALKLRPSLGGRKKEEKDGGGGMFPLIPPTTHSPDSPHGFSQGPWFPRSSSLGTFWATVRGRKPVLLTENLSINRDLPWNPSPGSNIVIRGDILCPLPSPA